MQQLAISQSSRRAKPCSSTRGGHVEVDFSRFPSSAKNCLETMKDPTFPLSEVRDLQAPKRHTFIDGTTNLEGRLPRTEGNVFIYCYKAATSHTFPLHIISYSIDNFTNSGNRLSNLSYLLFSLLLNTAHHG